MFPVATYSTRARNTAGWWPVEPGGIRAATGSALGHVVRRPHRGEPMTTATASRTSNAWHGFASGDLAATPSTSATSSGTTTRRTTAVPEFLVRPDRAHHRGLERRLTGSASRRSGHAASTTSTPHTPSHHHRRTRPGYIDRDHELIVGLQTDAPLQAGDHAQRRAADGRGRPAGVRLRARPGRHGDLHASTARPTTTACSTPTPPQIRAARRPRIITGLPDAYGRGRIIGDYRRVALYGVDRLIEAEARRAGARSTSASRTEDVIRDREELAEQIRALGELRRDGRRVRLRRLRPGRAPRREAVQWLYFAYLAATKEQNGAAMSLGRTVDVPRRLPAARPRRRAARPSSGAQELVDDFVIKLRIVRFLRTPEYDAAVLRRPDLGHRVDRRHRRATAARWSPARQLPLPADALQPRPGAGAEPDRAVVAARCPTAFKRFCAQVSIDTSADPVRERRPAAARVRRRHRDRLLRVGDAGRQGHAVLRRPGQPRQGAAVRDQRRPRRDHRRAGRARRPRRSPATSSTTTTVLAAFDRTLDWLAETYVDALNVIHYMHDKYAYERLEMALHDYPVHRFLACGIAGLSVAADSLSAIKHAQVKVAPRRDRAGRRLRGRRRLPDLRQQRRPGRRDRRRPGRARSWTRCAGSPTYRGRRATPSRC